MVNRSRGGLAFVTVLALAAGLRCSAGRNSDEEQDTNAPAGRSDQHWVQDEKVRAVMKQIAAATGSWPQDLPPHAEAANPLDLERAFDDSAQLASTLATAAAELPAAVADHPMPDEARRGFLAQAQTLRRHATELKEAARTHNVANMQRALGRINTTCFTCHDAYRDVAGELKSPQRGDLGGADGDHRVLGSDEEPVDRDQQGHGRERHRSDMGSNLSAKLGAAVPPVNGAARNSHARAARGR